MLRLFLDYRRRREREREQSEEGWEEGEGEGEGDDKEDVTKPNEEVDMGTYFL